jgi:hypothetical protein
MAFFWKGDQLYTKVGELPEYDELTTFLLEMRDPEEKVPEIKDFGKFLATSLAFTKCLRKINVLIDDVEGKLHILT